jgi:GNAT superfamily N-acetyltransferase
MGVTVPDRRSTPAPPPGRRVSSEMADGYPAELECRVVVGDGLVVGLRPIRPADSERLVEFHGRLSSRSVYRRYFFMHPNLSDVEVERLTHVDYTDRLALIAETDGEMVGVCRYDRSPGSDEAEVAFVVADEYQHHGIGTLLLERLAAAAWANGVATFVAQTLRENRAMLGVFYASGFPVTSTSEYDTVRVRFPIEPDDAYRSAVAARHAERSSAGPTP